MDANIYFGLAGRPLNRLWDPVGGVLATRERDSKVFTNKAGGTRTIRALDGARAYSLNYGALGRKTFEILNAYQQGHMGPGPFVLLDPGRRNLLTVNQSSGASATNDTRGFTVTGSGGTIASVPASASSMMSPMPNVLQWAFSVTNPGTASLTLNKPSTVWPGIPVINRPYTFWCVAGATGGNIDFSLVIDWLSLTGSVLSSATTFNLTANPSVPIRHWVTGTPPAGAYWALVRMTTSNSTITAGEALYFSQLMLNEGSAPDAQWVGGTGVYPVSVMSLPERYGFAEPGMMVSPTLILQEVR